jgi:hypothetical protein
MKLILSFFIFTSVLSCQNVYGQATPVNKVKFFEDTSIINATISTDFIKILRRKEKIGLKFPANFSAKLPDGTTIDEPIVLEVRGHSRRAICYLPPLKVVFKGDKTSVLKPLGSLKLVSQCYTSEIGEKYLLSEFLIYKMYNLFTDMSFRVRLLNLKLVDSSGKKKTITEYAYLIEDIKEVAKRNNCIYSKDEVDPRRTDDRQMTIAAIFEYMIGNTDWGVIVNHNTRLLLPKADTAKRPFIVPYDFDFSGLVNTTYAIPNPKLDIENVRQRLYRGFPEPIEVVNGVVDIFKNQKNNIYSLINNFHLLSVKSKKELTEYLDGFFELINNPKKVKYTFIDNARTE